ncbi:LysR substrate-binding domain-containing protein [Ornithinimicrobium pekingense]|uniref:LysR family transcriptional regulator n=1 Tax=Ornithinimicrobium pekingense TaxID=384677 RepID=A0ABQ2F9I5_9MICO|nr:LysR substrate-binding domain-containing protein [Ornithinimicrobium pekingense]GGK72613.1 LysR family transcriptional regulator [Ornithinimicrobium pekingense]
MFNPDHLITLRAVVEEGTVLAAADRLRLTPSAVSQQLGRLQEQVGQPVMVRQGRGLVPTDVAAVLVRLAHDVEELDERARAELDRLREQVSGPLVVAAFATALRGLVAPATRLLAQRYPHLEVTIREHTPEEAMPALRRGDVDLVLVHDWTDRHVSIRTGLLAHLLGLDPVDLATLRDEPLQVGPEGVDLDDLGGRVWIDDTPGVFSDWLRGALQERGLPHRIGATVDNPTARLELVAHGFGICLLPRLGRDVVPAQVVTHPLIEAPTRRVHAVHRDASGRRPAVEAAVEALRDVWRAREELPDDPNGT